MASIRDERPDSSARANRSRKVSSVDAILRVVKIDARCFNGQSLPATGILSEQILEFEILVFLRMVFKAPSMLHLE